MNDVRAELISVVKKVQPEAVLDMPDSFDRRFRDIGIDSLESMNVLLAIQEAFGLEISDEEFDRLNTLGQVLDFIQSNKGNA